MDQKSEYTRILIVDDELPIREWLKFTISSLDRDVEIVDVCKDGSEAYASYQKHRPDICIADIKMPVMNGIELLKNIKAYDDSAYIIMLTSHDDFELARQSLKYGATEYVLKNEVSKVLLEEMVDSFRQSRDGVAKTKFEYDDSLELKAILTDEENEVNRIPSEKGRLNTDQVVLTAHVKPGTDLSVFWNLGYKTEGVVSGYIYRYDRNRITFVAQLKHSSSHMDKYNHILALAKEIESISGSPVGASEVLDEAVLLEDAVQTSLLALGSSYYDAKVNCLYTASASDRDENILELQNRRNRIIELINRMSFEEAKEEINDLFDFLRHEKMADMEAVKQSLVDVIASYKLFKLRFDSEVLSKMAPRYQEWILNATSIDSMASTVDRFVEKAFDVESLEVGGYSSYVNKAIAFIREKYSEIEQIKDISDYLGLNQEYLCRLFKSETGDTLNNRLTKQRIKVACRLLKTTDLKVNEIAELVGYNSLSYFSRSFSKNMAQSPHEFRSDYIKNG